MPRNLLDFVLAVERVLPKMESKSPDGSETWEIFERVRILMVWLKDHYDMVPFLKVIDSDSGLPGVVCFGIDGEEIYREIPIVKDMKWRIRYLRKLIDSPKVKQNLIALKIDENI